MAMTDQSAIPHDGPEKPSAESLFRDDPVAVLRDFANDLAALRTRVLVLEKKLEAQEANRR
jgi:hypothetical protein